MCFVTSISNLWFHPRVHLTSKYFTIGHISRKTKLHLRDLQQICVHNLLDKRFCSFASGASWDQLGLPEKIRYDDGEQDSVCLQCIHFQNIFQSIGFWINIVLVVLSQLNNTTMKKNNFNISNQIKKTLSKRRAYHCQSITRLSDTNIWISRKQWNHAQMLFLP